MKGKPYPKTSNKKISTQKKKYPLRGKSVVYHSPMESVASNDWESMNNDYLVIREQLFAKETVKSLYKQIEEFQKKKGKK